MDDECRQSSSALDTSCWLASLKANGMEEPGLATLLFFIRMIIMTFFCYEKLLCALIVKCIEKNSAYAHHGFMTADKTESVPSFHSAHIHLFSDYNKGFIVKLLVIGTALVVCSCSAFAQPAIIPCENGYTVKIEITKTLGGKFRSHSTEYGTAILEQNGKTLSTVKLEENESVSYTREGSVVSSIEFDYNKNDFAVFVIDQGYMGFDGHASDGAFTLWADKTANKCLIEQVN